MQETKKITRTPSKVKDGKNDIIDAMSSYIAKLENTVRELKKQNNEFESEIWWLQTCSSSSLCPFCYSKVLSAGKEHNKTLLSRR